MPGEVIGFAKYREGYSTLGQANIKARLEAHASNMTVVDHTGKPLFSVPWGNFHDAYTSAVSKEGLADTGSFIARMVPLLDLTSAANMFYDGFRIRFLDNEIQRNQDVFFETGSERKAKHIVNQLFFYRDNFHRQLGNQGRPQSR